MAMVVIITRLTYQTPVYYNPPPKKRQMTEAGGMLVYNTCPDWSVCFVTHIEYTLYISIYNLSLSTDLLTSYLIQRILKYN
jgi:hypothetical protein